jgi:hypothetical protein
MPPGRGMHTGLGFLPAGKRNNVVLSQFTEEAINISNLTK